MTQDEILNAGLSLAMEFGENWLRPIQSRLAEKFPDLSSQELDEYNSICKSAMGFGNNSISIAMEKRDGQELNYAAWETAVVNVYPWINRENLARLFNQAMYYAWKDGFTG